MYKKGQKNSWDQSEQIIHPKGPLGNTQDEREKAVEGFGRFLKAVRTSQRRTIEEVAHESALEEGLIIALEEGFIPLQEIEPDWVDKIANSLDVQKEKLNLFLDRLTPPSKIQQLIEELRLSIVGILGGFWRTFEKNPNSQKAMQKLEGFSGTQQGTLHAQSFHNIINAVTASGQLISQILASKIATFIIFALVCGAAIGLPLGKYLYTTPLTSVSTAMISIKTTVTVTPSSPHVSVRTIVSTSIAQSFQSATINETEQPASVAELPLVSSTMIKPDSQPTSVIQTPTETETLIPTSTTTSAQEETPLATNTPAPTSMPVASTTPTVQPTPIPVDDPLPPTTNTPTPTPLPPPPPSVTPVNTATPIPTQTTTPAPTATVTPSPTVTPTPTGTHPSPTTTPSPSPSPTVTVTFSPTVTPAPTGTYPSPTATPLPSPSPTVSATLSPSPTPYDFSLELETIVTCDSWEVFAATYPEEAEVVFIPTNEGDFEMRNLYRVIVVARWPDGTDESKTIELAKPDNCDPEPTPTPTVEPQEYVLEVYSEVNCDGWLVWAEVTPDTGQVLVLPKAEGTFETRKEFTIEVRAFWPDSEPKFETIDIQEPEGCENDAQPTESLPQPDRPTSKALYDLQKRQKIHSKSKSADILILSKVISCANRNS